MATLPNYSVVVSAVTQCEELGGKVCIASQKVEGEWYTIGAGPYPVQLENAQNFFPAHLVFGIEEEDEK